MAAMWPGLAMLLLGVSSVYAQVIKQGPVNTAGLFNQKNQLNCTVENLGGDSVEWRIFNNITGPGGERIYISSNPSQTLPGYSVQTDGAGAYNLIIEDTVKENTGRYWCSIVLIGTSVPAEFVGVEEPQCSNDATTEVMADTNVALTCTDVYQGYIPPTLTWYNKYGENVASQIYSISSGKTTNKANLTVVAAMNNAEFGCWLHFPDKNYEEDPPEYTDFCTTKFSVIFGVMNMTIQPQPDEGEDSLVMVVGQTLNCSAEGNPEPRYDWYGPEGEIIPDTQFLDITEDMVNKGLLSYTCKATNEYNGQSRTVNATVLFTAQETSDGNLTQAGTPGWAIALAVILPILALVGIGILVYFLVLKKRGVTCGTKTKSKPTTSVNYNSGTQSSNFNSNAGGTQIYTPVSTQPDTTDYRSQSTRAPPATNNQFVSQSHVTRQASSRNSIDSAQPDGYDSHNSSMANSMGGKQVLPDPTGQFRNTVRNSPTTYTSQNKQYPSGGNNLNSSQEGGYPYSGSNSNLAGAGMVGGNLGRSNPDLAGAGAGLGQDPPPPVAQQYGRRAQQGNDFYSQQQQPYVAPRNQTNGIPNSMV